MQQFYHEIQSHLIIPPERAAGIVHIWQMYLISFGY